MAPLHEICPLPMAVGVGIPVLGGYISGLVSREGTKEWYESLKTPDWKPPKAAFPIVWTSLYGTMGYASYVVWRAGGGFHGPARLPLMMYGTQLAINMAWSPIFFGRHSLKGGLITIILLDAAVVATATLFYNVVPKAGYLMVPYIAWLSLATALTYRIWKDNPTITEVKDK